MVAEDRRERAGRIRGPCSRFGRARAPCLRAPAISNASREPRSRHGVTRPTKETSSPGDRRSTERGPRRGLPGEGLARSMESNSPAPQRSCPLPQDRLRLVAGSGSDVGRAGAHSTGAIRSMEPLLVPAPRIVALRGHVSPIRIFNLQNTHAWRGHDVYPSGEYVIPPAERSDRRT